MKSNKTQVSRQMKKSFLTGALVISGFAMCFTSCKNDPKQPGLEFMPDMYRSASYTTYEPNSYFKDSLSALKPVAGTIPRGYDTYFPYPNTNEGYEAAALSLVNPVQATVENIEEGKRLFSIYCDHCHGEKGDGKGTLRIKGEPFPVVSYFDDTRMALKDGHMFFSITHGKNLMGPHASQVNPEERWKIITYIKSLQQSYLAEKNKTAAPADTNTTAMSGK